MVNINPLFLLVKTSRIPVYKLAEQVGMSRNTIGRLIASDTLPRNVEIETLDKIAAELGLRVVVTFEPINDTKAH